MSDDKEGRTVWVSLISQDPEGAHTVGTAKVCLHTTLAADAITIPPGAITFTPPEDEPPTTHHYRVTETGDVLAAWTTEQPAPFDPTLRIE